MRRLFSRRQRRILYRLAGGLCEICRDHLSHGWHADHRIPFSQGGKTVVANGAALCPSCNLKKGNRTMGTPVLRKWQTTALRTLIDVWSKNPDSKVLVSACPGAGKTHLASLAARHAVDNGFVEKVLIIAPTTNIREQWAEAIGSLLTCPGYGKTTNEQMQFRLEENSLEYQAIVITYSQLAISLKTSKDGTAPEHMWIEFCRRFKTLVIADEVHHADDKKSFGVCLHEIAELATLKLALSGTPFNSRGGALAMCDSEVAVNDEGRSVRKTIPTVTYRYAEAIRVEVCRPVEFIKRTGKKTTEYGSLLSKDTLTKVLDLGRQNKTDNLGPLLEPNGEFVAGMLSDGLTALDDIQAHDKRAAMLIVVRDKEDGAIICENLRRSRPDMQVQQIYHDTHKSHERIRQLEDDDTDIVITVRMISEGVNVKRLRVGVFLSDWLTRMFFVQFVGRMVRWERRINGGQHAVVVIPSHTLLIEYALEIEKMTDEAMMPADIDNPDITPEEQDRPQSELISSTTETVGDGTIYSGRSIEEHQRAIAAEWMKDNNMSGLPIPFEVAYRLACKDNYKGCELPEESQKPNMRDWSKLNDMLVNAVVRSLKREHGGGDRWFESVQRKANEAVGIKRKDSMTPPDVLKRRHEYLSRWLTSIRNGERIDELARS